MKKLLAFILAMVMVLSMAACGTDNTDSTDKPDTTNAPDTIQGSAEKEPVTLRFYNYALSEKAKAAWWENTIAEFEKEHDWINIETVTVDFNSMITTLNNDIASGQTADLIYGENAWVPTLAEAGFIDKPSNVLSEDFYNGYYDYALDAFKYNDEVYGVPHYMTNWIIFVNKDLIEGAGLKMEDFPTTEKGLKEWIDKLGAHYKGSNVSTIFGVTTAEVPATGTALHALFSAYGGHLFNDDGSLDDLTSGNNKTAMSEMLDFCDYLIDNNYTQENLKLKDYRAAFGAGNVCMYIDQSWGYAQIGEVDQEASKFTVSAPLPTTMGTNGKGDSLISAHSFLLGSDLDDAKKEAVDLFVQYCTSNEVMEEYLNNIGLAFPAHENMKDCKISPILDGAAAGSEHVMYQAMPAAVVSIEKQLATTVLNYTINGMSLDDAIADYIQQAEYHINQ